MNPMLENEAMLSKMLAFVKKLFAEQQAEMKVTDKKSNHDNRRTQNIHYGRTRPNER